MFSGHVDIVSRQKVAGWAIDERNRDAAVDVDVFVSGRHVGRTLANTFRDDLSDAVRFGDGRRGFEFEFDTPLASDLDQEIVVRLGGTPWMPVRGHCLILRSAEDEPSSSGALVVFGPDYRPNVGVRGPRYIVHVGPHKTGTKFLQTGMSQLRDHLFAHGVTYPSQWVEPSGPSHYPLVRALTDSLGDLAAEFSRLNESPFRYVVLSSEDFVDLDLDGLHRLRGLIGDRPISLVYYCRRWSELLGSAWQETVKQGSTETLPAFIARHTTDPAQYALVNFDIALHKMADVFGFESIHLVSYSNLVDRGEDLLDHFLSMFCETPIVSRNNRAKENVSLDAVQTELQRVMNVIGLQKRGMPSPHCLERLMTCVESTQLDAVVDAMRSTERTFEMNDESAGLRSLHKMLFERYRSRLVEPTFGENLFSPGSSQIRYIEADYLLLEGISRELGRMYSLFSAQTLN